MSLDFLAGKTILITGGTGSFGQRCVRILLGQSAAARIVIFSRDELKQSQMQTEISDPDGRLRFFIGDIRDVDRLIMAVQGVDYIIHAAALKQVPALEYNPFEAIKTNILGTQNMIMAALKNKVEKMVLVSTDKAANPANLYGATKLCAERLMTSANAYSGKGGTKFSVVRYGNVLGSRGSIIKIIEQQRAAGEITLTHEDMTRFWITLDQGVEVVMMALEKMYGGEVFVPKLPSMKIKDFISLLAPDSKIKIVGIRPGEKLHEALVTPEEARHTKEYSSHYVILPEHDWWLGHDVYSSGTKVKEGFYFASHNNERWLDEEGMKKLLASL